MNSQFIKQILYEIPDFYEELEFFFSGFDHVTAQRDGVAEMLPGSFPELESAKANIFEWDKKFDNYLKDQENRLKYETKSCFNYLVHF